MTDIDDLWMSGLIVLAVAMLVAVFCFYEPWA